MAACWSNRRLVRSCARFAISSCAASASRCAFAGVPLRDRGAALRLERGHLLPHFVDARSRRVLLRRELIALEAELRGVDRADHRVGGDGRAFRDGVGHQPPGRFRADDDLGRLDVAVGVGLGALRAAALRDQREQHAAAAAYSIRRITAPPARAS